MLMTLNIEECSCFKKTWDSEEHFSTLGSGVYYYILKKKRGWQRLLTKSYLNILVCNLLFLKLSYTTVMGTRQCIFTYFKSLGRWHILRSGAYFCCFFLYPFIFAGLFRACGLLVAYFKPSAFRNMLLKYTKTVPIATDNLKSNHINMSYVLKIRMISNVFDTMKNMKGITVKLPFNSLI